MTTKQQAAANAERNRKFKERTGREMTYEDVILSFGGSFSGQSIVEPWQYAGRTVLREGEQICA